MIRIRQIRLPLEHTQEDLRKLVISRLRIDEAMLQSYEIVRQSLDARKKPELYYVYTVDVTVKAGLEKKILRRIHNNNIMLTKEESYQFPARIQTPPRIRPVIAGSGPAGLFCAWLLAFCGLTPIVLERGDDADTRKKKVDVFWNGGPLDEESNVQFGEGGAGTFSDGKLTTSVKDPKGRNRQVLRIFAGAGAGEEILWQQKPHLGTDQLIHIVKNLRRQIEEMGGTFRFGSKLTSVRTAQGRLEAIEINHTECIRAEVLVLAVGHSARDTFRMLYDHGIRMQPKAFAAGIRIEHPQEWINLAQYGRREAGEPGAASYKLTHRTPDGRGVYSFCMCPGGYVVNASSERGQLAINGMSDHARDSANANSAILVTVTPEDYRNYTGAGVPEALSGIAFQRDLEKKAYAAAGGAIPVQRFSDFRSGRKSHAFGAVKPCIRGTYAPADVRGILPVTMGNALEEGILAFGRKIPGFSDEDALLSAVESRSSSPVRMIRDDTFQSSIRGIYPCGEGAGYAGGITSAAIDGLKTAEAIAAAALLC